MKKKRFSDEQLQRASGIDIAVMLQGQGEKLKKQGRVYRWMRYDRDRQKPLVQTQP